MFYIMFEKVDQDYNIEDIQEKNKRTMKKKPFHVNSASSQCGTVSGFLAPSTAGSTPSHLASQ